MKLEFLSTVAVIAPDPSASRKLYVDALGLPLESDSGEYHHSEQINGSAAVGPAARELEHAGYELLHGPREEPWGQTVARLQSPEGAVIGISYAPVLHNHD